MVHEEDIDQNHPYAKKEIYKNLMLSTDKQAIIKCLYNITIFRLN
jgi:hypothetical protein